MKPDKDAFQKPPKHMRGKIPIAPSASDDEPYIEKGLAVEMVRKLGRVLAKPFRRGQGSRK